jgi:regulatory protein
VSSATTYTAKKAEPELIESLTAEFTTKGYLNNQKFGEWFIELQKRRSKSNRAIRSELYKKGISRELADELLKSESGDELERLKQMITKKQKLTRYKSDPTKLKRYLAGQGFGYDQINEALKNTPAPKNLIITQSDYRLLHSGFDAGQA